MFRNEFKSLNDLRFEGHKLLTKSFLVFWIFFSCSSRANHYFPGYYRYGIRDIYFLSRAFCSSGGILLLANKR